MALGIHVIADLVSCDEQLLNNSEFIEEMLRGATKAAGATEIKTVVHTFNPVGVTGVTVLAESHITIHTFPEWKSACIDAFTCGDHCCPKRAIDYIVKALGGEIEEITDLTRGKDFKFLTNEERHTINYD